MRGILDEGVLSVLDMRIYDDRGEDARDLLIDTRSAWRNAPETANPRFHRFARFTLPGRSWSVRFVSRPEFDAGLDNDRPWAILLVGIAASLVVFLLTAALVSTLDRAHH